MIDTIATDLALEAGIAEFLALARSANVFFEIVNDRLTVRAVDPDRRMWAPIRRLLDEIGIEPIERFVRRTIQQAYCAGRRAN
jgi:hypothetical protein